MTKWDRSNMEKELQRLINEARNREDDPTSVYRLAKLTGLSQPMLSTFASGHRGMSPANMEKVLAALGMTWSFQAAEPDGAQGGAAGQARPKPPRRLTAKPAGTKGAKKRERKAS